MYYFLPIVIVIYFIVPRQLKNLVLLIASLFFYFVGEPIYSLLMIGSSLSGYIHGILIGKARGTKYAKIPLISSLVVGLGLLGFFKYSNFFISNVNSIFRSEIGLLSIALPIGISFYTFQILSYTIDVYRGEAKVTLNPIDFATYVALFPQLIAGPIVRYTTVQDELHTRKHTFADVAYGVGRFAIGLGKKIIISNTLAEFYTTLAGISDKTVLLYWLYAIAFTLQIYFDFSGYSDMAIGLGRVFGFHFLENFNYPYISKSISEFWRRWHMSLGTWFRDYVYIPLGGNRVSKWRWIFNTFVVWMLTGFWHGAEWNFIIWGLYFGVILLLEKFFIIKFLDKLPRFVSHIYTLFLTIIGFVIFEPIYSTGDSSLTAVVKTIGGMFGAGDNSLVNEQTLYYLKSYWLILLVAAVLSTPLIKKLGELVTSKKLGANIISVLQPICYIVILFVCTASLINGSFNPFIYFRF